ncbi:hypothetical protein [Salinibacter altiplanensis]|uniref:hypothetical protein n=1 Tax=Salinibacter altiplanensis TaxID=1803181 RepID=UPI0012FFD457|nr:hypothetical protein [Salinibacter altiplanensis]
MCSKRHNFYLSNGLTIRSNLALPELHEHVETENPDIKVKVKKGKDYVELSKKESLEAQREEKKLIYAVPDVAYIRVKNGKSIDVYPRKEAEEKVLRLFVLGIAYGALLHQRGNLVLHSSAISTSDRACLFMGEKGAGKSTTASIFVRSGYSLLSDDLVAIKDGISPTVQPTTRHLKLWDDVNSIAEDISDRCYQSHPDVKKFTSLLKGKNNSYNFNICSSFVLEKSRSLRIRRLRPSESFQEIIRHSYISPKVMECKKRKTEHFRISANFVESVPMYKLYRPNDFSKSSALVKLVESTLNGKKL